MRQSLVRGYDTHRLADVAAPEHLKGWPLAAERGAGAASALMGYGGGLLRTQVGIYNTGVDAVQAVIDGKAVAAYVTRAQAESVLARHEAQRSEYRLSRLVLSGVPDNGWPVGMAIKTEHQALGQALETALQALRNSGELLAIFKQQGMTLTAP
jgi:ABC-type amino acid transport substrate-binding protein